jgi:nucleotide-binding universal stress UspA family protein
MRAHVLDTTSVLRIKNVLYATDLSFAAERALPYAYGIARRHGATIYVVHAIQPDIYPFVPPTQWPKMAEDEEVFRRESKAELEKQLEDVPHDLIFERGNVAQVLARIIDKKKIDLLVMGTHGRAAVQTALVGSVAEEMFRNAACPVLTVGPNVAAKPGYVGELKRILYATDFSVVSLAAAPFAVSLARESRAQLILLHCIEHAYDDVKGLRHRLADLVPFGAELSAEPDCIVERGQPVKKILEVAEGHGADLIVLGIHTTSHRRIELDQFLHPGVFKIVTEAKSPVLTVRG